LDAQDLRRQWANAVSRRVLVDALPAHLPFTLEELAQRLGYAARILSTPFSGWRTGRLCALGPIGSPNSPGRSRRS